MADLVSYELPAGSGLPPVLSPQERVQALSKVNATLLSTLSETDHAPMSLASQNDYIVELNRGISKLERSLRSLEDMTKKKLRAHEEYRDSKIKRALYGMSGSRGREKYASRLSKEEREYLGALNQERNAKEKLSDLQHMLYEARQHHAELEKQTNAHMDAQRRLDALYTEVFSGPTPEAPMEDRLEEALNHRRGAYEALQWKKHAEDTCVHHLQEADRAIREASRQIERALDDSTMNMVGLRAANISKRDNMHKVELKLQQVQFQLELARHAQPLVGDVPNVKVLGADAMGDIYFNNIFTRMSFHDDIQETKHALWRAAPVLANELKWALERQKVLQEELIIEQSNLEESRRALQDERSRALEHVLMSRS